MIDIKLGVVAVAVVCCVSCGGNHKQAGKADTVVSAAAPAPVTDADTMPISDTNRQKTNEAARDDAKVDGVKR